MRATLGGSESGSADDRWYSLWRPGAGGSFGDRGKWRKARFGRMARSHGEHCGGPRAFSRSGGARTGCAAERYLVVIAGSKALRADGERVLGAPLEVQRCQIHKRRNGKEYLPENCQQDYDRRRLKACAMTDYAEAKQTLQKIFRKLKRINPSAA